MMPCHIHDVHMAHGLTLAKLRQHRQAGRALHPGAVIFRPAMRLGCPAWRSPRPSDLSHYAPVHWCQ